ncbi:unnamed protein product [Peniophora sp. CBMAI 1063]|nr:unnamed protein product [Peniophora sp. CBMAI 1063]
MLLDLPNEILVLVLSPLGFRDLVVCKSVCRTLNAVICDVLFLQYKLVLASYGLCDNEFSVTAVKQRLQYAHLFNCALRDIRWIPHFTFTFEGQRLDHPSSFAIFRDLKNPGTLSLIYSGSSLRGAPQRHWVIKAPPASVYTYTFNPAEDLVILQTMDVPKSRHHLLTMSSGAQHPAASHPYLESETIGLDTTTFGPYLFVPGTRDFHTLWNWKTGEMVTNIRCHYYAVAFIDQDHLAIAAMTQGVGLALLIYRLPLIIYNEVTNVMQPAHYAFGLPTLHSQDRIREPRCCSLRRNASYPPMSTILDAGDFYSDPDDVLLSVESAHPTDQGQYEFFMPLRALQALMTPENRGRFTPWANWGPQHVHATPLLRYPPIVGWRAHCIFGMRRIGMYPTQREDGVLVAKIYDYHPRRVALARKEPSFDGRHWRVVDGENVSDDWLHSDMLETHLPFIEIEVPLPEEIQHHRGSMVTLGINDDSIVVCTDFIATRPNRVHIYTF